MTSTIPLEPGTRVRIKDHWESGIQNANGEMDHWLGEIMTIRRRIGESTYRMEEDVEEIYDGWSWSPKDFDVIDETQEDCTEQSFTHPTDQDFLTLFGMLPKGGNIC